MSRVVLVTGAAGGIGAATARELARRGARLVLLDVDGAGLASVAQQVGDDRVACETCDVRDLEAVQRAVDAGFRRFGGLDAVIANAAVGDYGFVDRIDPLAFQKVLDVNVAGVFHTVRATLPALVERRGYVLVVSSIAAYAPAPGLAAYAASKAAVEQFATVLRAELAPSGVAVGSAHMSWIDTPLLRRTTATSPELARFIARLPPTLRRTTSPAVCADRFATAVERRPRVVDVPRWIRLARWAKPVLAAPTR